MTDFKTEKIILYDFLAEKMYYYSVNGTKFVGTKYQRTQAFPDETGLSYELARWVLSRYNLPKNLHNYIISQMIELGFLKRISKRELRLTKKKLNYVDLAE